MLLAKHPTVLASPLHPHSSNPIEYGKLSAPAAGPRIDYFLLHHKPRFSICTAHIPMKRKHC